MKNITLQKRTKNAEIPSISSFFCGNLECLFEEFLVECVTIATGSFYAEDPNQKGV